MFIIMMMYILYDVMKLELNIIFYTFYELFKFTHFTSCF